MHRCVLQYDAFMSYTYSLRKVKLLIKKFMAQQYNGKQTFVQFMANLLRTHVEMLSHVIIR